VSWITTNEYETLQKKVRETAIATDVRKIECNIEKDGSYTCDLTSGKYVSWFAECIGKQLRGQRGVRTVGGQNIMRHRFRDAAMRCVGSRDRYETKQDINILGEPIPQEGEPQTIRYFAKELLIGKGIIDIVAKKNKLTIKSKSGITCFFDEDKDRLICDRKVLGVIP